MPQTLSNFSAKTRPKTTSLQSKASTFPPTKQKIYKSSTTASFTPDKMASKTPVEIGTRGTVGSLIMQEIEYFNRLELRYQNSQNPRRQLSGAATKSNYSRPKLGSMIAIPTRRKRVSSSLIPSMCSMVDVAEPKVISGFSYRNLKLDVKRLQV